MLNNMVLYGTVSAQYHTISYRFNHFTSPPWDSFGLAPPRQLRGRHRTGHRAHGAIAAAQADVDVALAQTVLPEGAEKFWKVLKDAEKYLMILRHLDVWICSMYIANNFCQWLSRSCGTFPKVLTWNPVLLWKLAWGLAMRLGLHYLLILKCGTSSIQKKTMIQLNLAEFIITMWHSDIIHQAFQKCMTLPQPHCQATRFQLVELGNSTALGQKTWWSLRWFDLGTIVILKLGL